MIARNPLYLPEVTGESSQVADSGHISIPMPSQALQLVDNRDKYLESRSDAIEGIEKTIGDLANIFSQLTTMISAHDDLVRRY